MTHEELKSKGTLIGEEDSYNGGIYRGTYYYYIFDDALYCHWNPDNKLSYNGKKETFCQIVHLGQTLEERNELYFTQIISERIYKKICEYYKNVK